MPLATIITKTMTRDSGDSSFSLPFGQVFADQSDGGDDDDSVVMTTTWTSTIYRSLNKEKVFACIKVDIHHFVEWREMDLTAVARTFACVLFLHKRRCRQNLHHFPSLLAVAINTSQGKLIIPLPSECLAAVSLESFFMEKIMSVPFDSIKGRIEFAVDDM